MAAKFIHGESSNDLQTKICRTLEVKSGWQTNPIVGDHHSQLIFSTIDSHFKLTGNRAKPVFDRILYQFSQNHGKRPSRSATAW